MDQTKSDLDLYLIFMGEGWVGVGETFFSPTFHLKKILEDLFHDHVTAFFNGQVKSSNFSKYRGFKINQTMRLDVICWGQEIITDVTATLICQCKVTYNQKK